MKRFTSLIISLLLAAVACAGFIGCVPETEYDDKTVVKIETVSVEGMSEFQCSYVRTFDFGTHTVTDMRVADPDTVAERVPESNRAEYNVALPVATFDCGNAVKFTEEIKSLGVYAWRDRYVTDDLICDMGNETVTFYFDDGTVKSTYFYALYPKNFKKTKTAFQKYLGAYMFMNY